MGAFYCCENTSTGKTFEIDLKDQEQLKMNLSGRVNVDLIPHKDNIVVKSVGTDKKTNSELSLEKLKTIYENAKNSAEEVKLEVKSKLGDSYIYIDCRSKWTMEFVKTLSDNCLLPKEILGIGIGYLDEKNEIIKQFFK